MQTPLFLKDKISRLLKTNGMEYTFTLMCEDEYKQPKEGEVVTIKGIYHEANSFITVTASDSASVQRKKSPMIRTLFNEEVEKLKQGDKVLINSVPYKVSGVLDIQNYGVAADISLEMEV